MDSIGVRELRQEASRHLKAVAEGHTLTITDRGTPVALLTPVSPLESRLRDRVREHGLLAPARSRRRFAADVRLGGPALELAEDRDERDPFAAP